MPDRDVLSEQIDYYRQRAAEYDETAYGDLAAAERRIADIVDTLPTVDAALEIACGTGMWTRHLARQAAGLTALDSSVEMLAIARERCGDNVTFVHADAFDWRPSQRYELIFFGFWLSHVPSGDFRRFFDGLDECLSTDGRIVFVDEHFDQAAKEHRLDEDEIVQRRLQDGSRYRIVKVFLDPTETVRRLGELGWQAELRRHGSDWVLGTVTRAG